MENENYVSGTNDHDEVSNAEGDLTNGAIASMCEEVRSVLAGYGDAVQEEPNPGYNLSLSESGIFDTSVTKTFGLSDIHPPESSPTAKKLAVSGAVVGALAVAFAGVGSCVHTALRGPTKRTLAVSAGVEAPSARAVYDASMDDAHRFATAATVSMISEACAASEAGGSGADLPFERLEALLAQSPVLEQRKGSGADVVESVDAGTFGGTDKAGAMRAWVATLASRAARSSGAFARSKTDDLSKVLEFASASYPWTDMWDALGRTVQSESVFDASTLVFPTKSDPFVTLVRIQLRVADLYRRRLLVFNGHSGVLSAAVTVRRFSPRAEVIAAVPPAVVASAIAAFEKTLT